jgi:hypothetical protein
VPFLVFQPNLGDPASGATAPVPLHSSGPSRSRANAVHASGWSEQPTATLGLMLLGDVDGPELDRLAEGNRAAAARAWGLEDCSSRGRPGAGAHRLGARRGVGGRVLLQSRCFRNLPQRKAS